MKAKKNIKDFKKLQDEISAYLDTIYNGGYSVSYNVEKQAIDVKANLNDKQIEQLNAKFGADLLSITSSKEEAIPAYARNYPFLNVGGGQEILFDPNGTADASHINNYGICSSGYIAYKNNQAYMVTAGHCTPKSVAGGSTYEVIEGNSSDGYQTLGYQHYTGYNASQGYDLGLIRLTNSEMDVTSRFYTNNSGTGKIDGQLNPYLTVSSSGIKTGLAINKSGRTTGITGGTVSNADSTVKYTGETFSVKVLEVDLRAGFGTKINGTFDAVAGQGDSGCTVYRASDYALVGVLSGVSTDYTFNNTKYGNHMFVTPAWYASTLLGSNFYQYNFTDDTPVSNMQG